MPPRPFPLPLRVGTDIVSVSRIHNAMTRKAVVAGKERSQLRPFLRKLFTVREVMLFDKQFPNISQAQEADTFRAAKHLAGRWAAKEAAIKASKPRKITLMDVEILKHNSTAGVCALIRDNTFVWTKEGKDWKHVKLADEEVQEGEAAAVAEAVASAGGDAPKVTAPEAAAKKRSDRDDGGQIAIISISHERDYATAVCIAPFGPIPGDVGGEAEARMYDDAAQDGTGV